MGKKEEFPKSKLGKPTLAPRASGRGEAEAVRRERKRRAGGMRSREEGQEGTWALLSPSPMWGAPGKEHGLGEPSKEQRTRSPALVGPGTARQER